MGRDWAGPPLARVYFVVLRVDRRGTTTTTGMERGKKETVGGGISMAVSPSADVRGGADRVVVGGAPALTTSKRGKGGMCARGGLENIKSCRAESSHRARPLVSRLLSKLRPFSIGRGLSLRPRNNPRHTHTLASNLCLSLHYSKLGWMDPMEAQPPSMHLLD